MQQDRKVARPAPIILVMIVVSFMLSACAVRLAPDYDEGVVGKLNAINEKLSTYFVSFNDAATYDSRKGFYDDGAGQVMALVTGLKARPMPQPILLDWLGGSQVDKRVAEIANNSAAPSIGAMEDTLKQITYLRDEDKAGKLTRAKVTLTQGVVEAFMIDALTYEMALKR